MKQKYHGTTSKSTSPERRIECTNVHELQSFRTSRLLCNYQSWDTRRRLHTLYTINSVFDRARHYTVFDLRHSMASSWISHHAPVRKGSPFLFIHGGLGGCLYYYYWFHTTKRNILEYVEYACVNVRHFILTWIYGLCEEPQVACVIDAASCLERHDSKSAMYDQCRKRCTPLSLPAAWSGRTQVF